MATTCERVIELPRATMTGEMTRLSYAKRSRAAAGWRGPGIVS